MLDDVGMFDGDLAGWRKGPQPVRKSMLWMAWFAMLIPAGLLAANMVFGFGFLTGLMYCAAAFMVFEARK